jgi:anti-sigma-K factor RskA
MNEQLEEQASLYVLGLLEQDEISAFEQRLESDSELQVLVDQLDAAAAAVSHSAPQRALPAELRDRVLAQVRGRKIVGFPRRSAWIPWSIAACLALTSAYLIAERGGFQKRIRRLEESDMVSRIQITMLNSQVGNMPNAIAVVAWDGKKQGGVFKAFNLPHNEESRDYQLWLIDPRYKDPVNAGVFHLVNDGTLRVPFQASARVRDVQGFALSLERRGGVPKPEGPIVLLGK